jgi:GT2 family glycosyltransferase
MQSSFSTAMSEAGGTAALAAEIRQRLGPPPELPSWPLVSIVVLNRDGVDRLRNLLAGLREHTDYPNLELILVDNASTDDSLDFIRTVEAPFPISILANHHNESFSDGCNQGAELAGGELLLFLNNDVEPFESGWLRELVACLQESGAGAVGPTLIGPASIGDTSCEYTVHQRGLRVREAGGHLFPAYRDHLTDPLGNGLGEDIDSVVVVAACLLISRRAFDRVGGFTHGYWYGPEDVDIALKLREQGLRSVCSGRSALVHPPGSTLSTIDSEQRAAWVRGNRRLFMERWGPRFRREYELDRMEGGRVWAEPDPTGVVSSSAGRVELEALGFCLRADAAAGSEADSDVSGLLEALCDELRGRGHRCLVQQDAQVEDLAGLDYDVAVHLRGAVRYIPKPAQLNVLWSVSHADGLTAIECSRYDLVVSERGDLIRRLGEEGVPAAALAVLEGGDVGELAESLVATVAARASEIGFRTRIDT